MEKIEQKITGQKILSKENINNPIQFEREELIYGITTKIKCGNLNHAMYITVNFQNNKPIEVFINTKDPSHYQWITTITRMLSAIFRKGGEYEFIIEEMKQIHDPIGGYYAKLKKGEKTIFFPSLIAHIGYVIENSIKSYPNVST
jgi:hypothetical protein